MFNKKETIEQLKTLQAQGCEIAEVICDVSATGEIIPCYPKESFLVYLVRQPNNDDQIIRSKHYTVCNSIRDFKIGVVFGEGAARRLYSKYFVSKVYTVREFRSDFEQ